MPKDDNTKRSSEDVSRKLDEMLQETRVIVPGAMAIMGFQFAVFFNSGFRALENPQKYMHLVNLLMFTIAVVMLISLVPRHQIRYGGRDRIKLYRQTRRVIIVALCFIAVGFSGDIYVASDITMRSDLGAALLSGAMLIFIISAWFLRQYLRRGNTD